MKLGHKVNMMNEANEGELGLHSPGRHTEKAIRAPFEPFADFFGDITESRRSHAMLNDRQKERIALVNQIKADGQYLFQQVFETMTGPTVTIDDRPYKLISTYDYLGLIGHKKIERSAIRAIREFGTSSGGVRLLTGTNDLHIRLEKELAKFIGTEAAVTYSSGYHANLAVLSSLMTPNDVVLLDSKIHQSTLDACKLAGVAYRRFEHNNSESLEELLKRHQKFSRRMLIISEGTFSMDGDVCNLNDLIELKSRYGAFLMIDEAHSLGVLGKEGRGVAAHFNRAPSSVDIYTGSLSKGIPASGGYVATTRELSVYLQHSSSPYIFSAALSPAATASARTSLKILTSEPQRHYRLWENSTFLRTELQNFGFNTGLSTTPIIPVIFGSDEETLIFARRLFDKGVLATPVLFPAVAKGQSRLRLCATAAQDKTFLEEVVDIFRKLR